MTLEPTPERSTNLLEGQATTRKILLSGGSGLIGTSLLRSWMQESVSIVRLTRARPAKTSANSLVWDPTAEQPFSDPRPLEGVDAAVHLSGASVAGRRWTAAYKREIVSSRIQSTLVLSKALTRLSPMPRVLVCASAVGIYGDRGDELLSEDSAPGSGFLAKTCVAWEKATKVAEEAGIRVVHARFAVVFSPEGGALAKLLPLFRLGLGGRLGSGRQWMPWITLRDAVGILRFSLEHEAVRGAVNVAAPGLVTNAGFTRALAAALHRPAALPAPAFALRLAFGEMADESLLASARVEPARLREIGYRFVDPEIGPALQCLLSP